MMTKQTYYLSDGIGTFVMMLIGLSAITLNFGTGFMVNSSKTGDSKSGGIAVVSWKQER